MDLLHNVHNDTSEPGDKFNITSFGHLYFYRPMLEVIRSFCIVFYTSSEITVESGLE